MKKRNTLQIVLEAIIFLGNLIVGVTMLTYILQNEALTKTLFGLIVTAISALSFAEFFTLKYAAKRKSFQSMIISLLGIGFGITLVFLKVEKETVCLMLAISQIVFIVGRCSTSILNLTRQPLLNITRIIISLVGLVFSIVLLVRGLSFIKEFFTFVGFVTLIEAVILIIEFLIHRYQK